MSFRNGLWSVGLSWSLFLQACPHSDLASYFETKAQFRKNIIPINRVTLKGNPAVTAHRQSIVDFYHYHLATFYQLESSQVSGVMYPLSGYDTSPRFFFPHAQFFVSVNKAGAFFDPLFLHSEKRIEIVKEDLIGDLFLYERFNCSSDSNRLKRVFLDDNQMIEPSDALAYLNKLYIGLGHMTPGEVSQFGEGKYGVFGRMVSRLLASYATVTLYEVVAFSDSSSERVHGYFDFSVDNSPLKQRWYYIQGKLVDGELDEFSPIDLGIHVLPATLFQHINALVVRGSMSKLFIPNKTGIYYGSEFLPFNLFELITQRREAYMVEGWQVGSVFDMGETGYDMMPNPSGKVTIKSLKVRKDFKFSYELGMRMTHLKRSQ